MTAHAMKGDRERCIAGGMDAYISKPIDAKQLFDAVESLNPARARSADFSVQQGAGIAKPGSVRREQSESSGDLRSAGNDSPDFEDRRGSLPASAAAGESISDEALSAASSGRSVRKELNPQTAAPPVDWDTLVARVGGDEKFLLRLVDVFLADCPLRMAAIRKALTEGHSEELARETHTLKGAVGNFGISGLENAARELEMRAREGNLISARTSHAILEEKLEAFTDALSAAASRAEQKIAPAPVHSPEVPAPVAAPFHNAGSALVPLRGAPKKAKPLKSLHLSSTKSIKSKRKPRSKR